MTGNNIPAGDTRARALFRLALCAAVAAEVCLFIPATVYLGNIDQFTAAPLPVLRTLLAPALVLVLAGAVAGGWAERRGPGRFPALVAALGLLVWLQAFLLVWDYGALDGGGIDWTERGWRGVFDGAIWIGVLALTIRFARRLERPLAGMLALICVLQSGLLAVTAYGARAELAEKSRRPAFDDLDEMRQFSRRQNVLHVILDSFQSDIFREILESGDYGSRVREALDGFVFYEENLGIFPYTYFALPAIVSGEIYRNHKPKERFFDEVFGGDTVLNAAHAAGFEVDIATEPPMIDMLVRGRYTNAYLVPGHHGSALHKPATAEAAKLLDLSLFRLAPHFVKPLVYRDQRWLVQQWFGDPPLMRYFYYAHNAFLAIVSENLVVARDRPVYKFFHIMSPHAPMVVKPDCTFAGKTLARRRDTVISQSRCTLEFVIELLERMKKEGIYRDALIVLMGDHGGHIPPDRFHPPETGKHGFVLNPWVVAMATPLLLVKLPGAEGPLRVSTAATSSLDAAATIDAVLGLDGAFPGENLAQTEPAPSRERVFHVYEWRKKDYVTDYIRPIRELIVTGSAYDNDAWRFGDTFEPPAGAE